MAVDLSVVRGSVAEVAKELAIDPSLLSKWRRNLLYNGDKVLPDNAYIILRCHLFYERRLRYN
ncbi:transposase [Sphingobacterium sp. SGR-19]|nr:transposase [Sphingobacterium sp. SGR-19]